MPRFSTGGRTGAGSTTLPIISLYSGGTTSRPSIREIGVSNTTAVAVAIKLTRMSSAGTQGAGLTETPHDGVSAALATGFNTHTVAPTLSGDLGYNFTLGAAAGAGIVWTFGDTGLIIPAGTGNGIGVLVATGTGQICDAYIVWDD